MVVGYYRDFYLKIPRPAPGFHCDRDELRRLFGQSREGRFLRPRRCVMRREPAYELHARRGFRIQ